MDATGPLESIIDQLAEQGWCVRPGFLAPERVTELATLTRQRQATGALHPAGMGAGQPVRNPGERGDHIQWLEGHDPHPAVQAYLADMEALRHTVNRSLFMGLMDLECHLAWYGPGAGYRRHLDRFRDDDRRALTAIVYLNPDWRDEDGGHLRFWTDPDGMGPDQLIPPLGGTLVTFLSDRFWHQVLPARRDRLSVTGWFRRR